MGLAYVGIGVGGAIVPLLSVWLVQQVGWHAALRILGVLVVLVAFPMAYFVKESPDTAMLAVDSTSSKMEPIGWVFRKPAFYLLAFGSMCSIGAVGGTNQHLKLFLGLDQHFTQQHAAGIVSLVLASSLVGRVVMGWLADRFPKKYVMLLIYLLVASAIPLLFVVEVPGALVVFAIVFGVGLGGDYMIIPLMAAELFGLRVMGRLLGVVLTADGIAEAVAPMLVGYLRDRTGAYTAGFVVLIGLAVAGAAAVALLPRTPAHTSTDRCEDTR
jgi:sugar phosphate permease